MKRRLLFTTLALAALLSLATATPSQAGATLVTTTASFVITAPAGTTASDFEFDYTPVDPITGLTITSTSLTGATIAEGPANDITVSFTAASSGFVDFSFYTNAPAADVGLNTFFLTGASHPIRDSSLSVVVTPSSVPEPASLALLGIGITGFLAVRRFLKRAPRDS
jgi:hypothetical protein